MARKKPSKINGADPAPEPPTTEAPTEATGASEPPAHDDQVDAAAPLLEVHFEFHREFRKHAKTGELVAIELVNGALNGVRRCSKPEEQTAGALPVMSLDDRESAVGQWYRAESVHFKTWEPAPLPKAMMEGLSKLYEESVEARNGLEKAKLRMKSAKAWVEDVDERIFQLLRRLHETPDQPELPLEASTPEPLLPLEADQHAQDAITEVAEQTETEFPEAPDPLDPLGNKEPDDDPPAWSPTQPQV